MKQDNIFAEVEKRKMDRLPILAEEARRLPNGRANTTFSSSSDTLGEVSSVAEYLSLLSRHACKWFRGEPQYFEDRLSGVLRANRAKYAKSLLNGFRREVVPQLNENERLNFVAFAQHHGVPTNLLDVSTSPLTALYFVCETGGDADGYVYGFGDDCIDMTEILDGRDNYFYDAESLFDLLCDDVDANKAFIRELKRFRSRNIIAYRRCYVRLARFLRSLLEPKRFADLITECFDTSLSRSIEPSEVKATQKSWFSVDKFISACDTYNPIEVPDAPPEIPPDAMLFLDNDELAYAHLLNRAIRYIGSVQTAGQRVNVAVDFLPNLVYRPVAAFDRSKSQQSSFIVQPFLYGLDGTLIWQRLNTSLAIKISGAAKKSIIRELDRLDVNEKTIYNDFDHTASYVVKQITSSPLQPEEMLYP